MAFSPSVSVSKFPPPYKDTGHSGFCVCACMRAQSCPTLCDPIVCSPPGSSVQVIFQTRVLECIAISYSRGSSRPRDQIQVSCVFWLEGRFFTTGSPGKPYGGFRVHLNSVPASLIAQLVKNLPAMRETWVGTLGWEDSLENRKATHSSVLA